MMSYLPKLLLAIFTLTIGLWLINSFIKFIDKTFKAKEVDPTLAPFLKGIIRIILKVMLFIMVATMVGIETSSLLAMLGAASLAIGLALQGSLANFAGGVLILILKPFKAGHVIESNGVLGTVLEIQLFYTLIKTPQGQKITIPNGSLSNSIIKNISHFEERRMDIVVGISYSSNIKVAKNVISKILDDDTRILKEPFYRVFVEDLADSSVNLKIQAWVKQEQYWDVVWEIKEKIKLAFDSNNIEIPFPQRVIHQAK
jgi:small conductance mechanosensitive channel